MATPLHDTRFLAAVNSNYQDKVKPGDGRFYAFNRTFETVELTAWQLLGHIGAGHAWTQPHVRQVAPGKRTYRTKWAVRQFELQHGASIQAFAFDVETLDERSSLRWWAQQPLFEQHGAFVHTTASHTEDAPRCRVVWVLTQPVSVEFYERLYAALLWRFAFLDASVRHAAAVYYGARGCEYRAPGQLLPVELAQRLVDEHETHLQNERDAREAAHARQTTANAVVSAPGAANTYVQQAVENELAHLAGLQGGHGQRHSELLRISTRLASLAAAAGSWHSVDASSWQQAVVDACHANGYCADYGQNAVERALSTWQDTPPADEPQLSSSDYFEVGQFVEVLRQGKLLAAGTLERMRQAADGGHWETFVSGVWYPKQWLRHAGTEQPPDSAGQPTAGERQTTGQTAHQTAQQAVGREFCPPPPPENFPPGWNLASNEAHELFAAVDVATLQDGRQRDIYARLATPDTRTIDLEPGHYLTADVLPYETLPRLAQLNANTGTGKTTYALAMPGQKIVATSSTTHLEQLLEKHPTAHAYYGELKNATPDSELILTTYESFGRLLATVDASRFSLVVDEVHNFAASSDRAFRGRALNAVMDTLNGAWQRVLLITGTPVPLCHPNMRQFAQLNVRSHVRGQLAQRVVWQQLDEDGRPRGNLLDTVAEMCHTSQRHLVYLNDKKRAENLVGKLVAAGWQRDTIALFNSDTKHDTVGQSIVEAEQVPDSVRVLITTQLAVEALNLHSTFDCVHLASEIHTHHAQQLVNRLRTAAAGVVYWYNAGGGRGYDAVTAEYQAHFLRQAQRVAADLNELASVNPNDDSAAGVLARRSMRLYSQAAMRMVRIDEQLEDGRRWYDIDYLATDHAVFEAITEYTARNPTAFKNALTVYGWAWLGDELRVATRRDASTRAQAQAVTTELRDAREAAHLERVELLQQAGVDEVRQAAKRHEDGAVMRTAQQVVAMLDAIAPTTRQQDAFVKACELVGMAQDSKAKLNRLRKQIRIQQLRLQQDAFTLALFAAFKVGDMLTSDEIQQRVVDVYDCHEVMRLASRRSRRYPFSTQDETPVTSTRATRLLSDIYSVKRTTQRDAAGEVVHVYQVTGEHAAAEFVATFVGNSNKQTKVATNGAAQAFAVESGTNNQAEQTQAGTAVASVADEIPFSPDETAAYAALRGAAC